MRNNSHLPSVNPERRQRPCADDNIQQPTRCPEGEEMYFPWRFRFSLVDNQRALTDFLQDFDWTFTQWRKSIPLEIMDALKVLNTCTSFQSEFSRSCAIDTLASAPDGELRLYLLELVQALKYENMNSLETSQNTSRIPVIGSCGSTSAPCSLAILLICRAAGNIQLANYLYWYLKVELTDPVHGTKYRKIFAAFRDRLSKVRFSYPQLAESRSRQLRKSSKQSMQCSNYSPRSRARSSEKAIIVEPRTMWDVLIEQDDFITEILGMQECCRLMPGKTEAKESRLRSLLYSNDYCNKLRGSPVPLPSTPDIFVNGVDPESVKIFKSALYPALIEFRVESTIRTNNEKLAAVGRNDARYMSALCQDRNITSCKMIVKTGDDLRQDQLVMTMIQLMDRLLKQAGLDLCLTPYSIIATSPSSGLVEFVDGAIPISQILNQHNNSILQFFESNAPLSCGKHGVRQDVISTFVRSCAGYCVITYILGVGDRHLDNMLLRSSGHFFHIDFGFILGRDPKPLPPAFRLTREMVDGMGGIESEEYRRFCSIACEAFNALRKSAGLVLNLLHLMSDARIEALSNNPAAEIAKVAERFRLNLTDEQAERYFLGLINDCLSAIAPRVMDVFHSFAVSRR